MIVRFLGLRCFDLHLLVRHALQQLYLTFQCIDVASNMALDRRSDFAPLALRMKNSDIHFVGFRV